MTLGHPYLSYYSSYYASQCSITSVATTCNHLQHLCRFSLPLAQLRLALRRRFWSSGFVDSVQSGLWRRKKQTHIQPQPMDSGRPGPPQLLPNAILPYPARFRISRIAAGPSLSWAVSIDSTAHNPLLNFQGQFSIAEFGAKWVSIFTYRRFRPHEP